jgi:hypothetical protein
LTRLTGYDCTVIGDPEKEEFLLLYGPRKVRKAIKERRKAREQAQQKHQSES